MIKQNAKDVMLVVLTVFSAALGEAATDQSGLMAWPVDAMMKIYTDVVPPTGAANQVVIEAARRELLKALSE